MKREQVSVWAVQVRRESIATVLVKTADPQEAREIAMRVADHWSNRTEASAYPLEGKPTDRVYVDGGWQYPQTELLEESTGGQ